MQTDDGKARIRALNDQLRQSFEGGRIVITQGVNALPAPVIAKVTGAVRTFSAFSQDNDPYGEHDFGSFEIAGEKFFWKIDYYSLDMNGGSEDPADPAQTERVLTIMLASEY